MSSQEQHTKRTATAVTAASATIGAVAYLLADGEQEQGATPGPVGRDPFDEVVPPTSPNPAARSSVPDARPTDTPTDAPASVDSSSGTTIDVTAPAPTAPATDVANEDSGTAEPAVVADTAEPTDVADTDETADAADTAATTDTQEVTDPEVVTPPVEEAEPTPPADPLDGRSLTINVEFGSADEVVAPTVPTIASNQLTDGPLGDIVAAVHQAQQAQPTQPVVVAEPDPIVVDPITIDLVPNAYNTIEVTVQAMPEPEPQAEPAPAPDPVFVPAIVNLGILDDPAPTGPVPPRTPKFDANGPETVVTEQLTFVPGTVLPGGEVVGSDGHAPKPVGGSTADWATTGYSQPADPKFDPMESSMIGVMAGGAMNLFSDQERHGSIDDRILQDDDQ
jgi:hypothetical protein